MKSGTAANRMALSFLCLEAETPHQWSSVPVLREYYTWAAGGRMPVSRTFVGLLETFENAELLYSKAVRMPGEEARRKPTPVFKPTEYGLAAFGLMYLQGLTEQFVGDVSGFQSEVRTPVGRMALGAALGDHGNIDIKL